MKFRLFIIAAIGQFQYSQSLESLTFSPDQFNQSQKASLETYLQLSPEEKNENLNELREAARNGLYYDERQPNSVNFLTALGMLTQDDKTLVVLADYLNDEEFDLSRAIPLYQQAMKWGNWRALQRLVSIYLSKDTDYANIDLAHKLLMYGSRYQDDFCLCKLAQELLKGTFGSPDYDQAFRLFQLSAGHNYMLAITEQAELLRRAQIFPKPDYVNAYELVHPHFSRDNRARIMGEDLMKQPITRLYHNGNYLAVAQAYFEGVQLPLRLDRVWYFLNAAYTSHQISRAELRYYRHYLEGNNIDLPWKKPSKLDLFLNFVF